MSYSQSSYRDYLPSKSFPSDDNGTTIFCRHCDHRKPFTQKGLRQHFKSSVGCHKQYLKESEELELTKIPAAATHRTEGANNTPLRSTAEGSQNSIHFQESEKNEQQLLQDLIGFSKIRPHLKATASVPEDNDDGMMMQDDDDPSVGDREASPNDSQFTPTEEPYREEFFPIKPKEHHSRYIQDLYEQSHYKCHADPSYEDPKCKVKPHTVAQLYDLRRDRLKTFDLCQQYVAQAVDRNTQYMAAKYGLSDLKQKPQNQSKSPVTMSRNKTLKELSAMYGMGDMKPVKRTLKLPHTGVTTTLVSYPFAFSLLSLLTDTCLMQSDNLLLPPDQPCGGPPPGCLPNAPYDDIDSGSVFQDAYKNFCKDKDKDVLCGLILGSDGTTIDALRSCEKP